MGVDQTLKCHLTSGEDWTRHKSGSVVGRHLLGFLNFVSSVALAVETDAGLGDDDGEVCGALARKVQALDMVVGLAFPNGTWGLTLRAGRGHLCTTTLPK